MLLYNFTESVFLDDVTVLNQWMPSNEFFILCRVSELSSLQSVFSFDKSTILECTDLDESVRFAVFPGYDFISLVHMNLISEQLLLQEINLYIARNYLVVVLPDQAEGKLAQFETSIQETALSLNAQDAKLNHLLYSIFHLLLLDFSETLEALEDDLTALQEQIIDKVENQHLEEINHFRQITYTIKRILRATSYLGEDILFNHNDIIEKASLRYFGSIDTRLKKFYDFAESLYGLSNSLLDTYNSQLTAKTNDMVNKLTVITLLFAPLTLITGIYGMNFDFMPELHWTFGYLGAIGLMAVITGILFWILKRNKWL